MRPPFRHIGGVWERIGAVKGVRFWHGLRTLDSGDPFPRIHSDGKGAGVSGGLPPGGAMRQRLVGAPRAPALCTAAAKLPSSRSLPPLDCPLPPGVVCGFRLASIRSTMALSHGPARRGSEYLLRRCNLQLDLPTTQPVEDPAPWRSRRELGFHLVPLHIQSTRPALLPTPLLLRLAVLAGTARTVRP